MDKQRSAVCINIRPRIFNLATFTQNFWSDIIHIPNNIHQLVVWTMLLCKFHLCQKARIGFAWASPGDWFNYTDVILGSTFYFNDHGAITVPVYGRHMRIVVWNDGATTLRITQLSVNAVAR